MTLTFSNNRSNRLHWLDAMKAFGITLIVMGHYTPPYFEYLYTFSVQMFFIMSGFLSKPVSGNLKFHFQKIVKQLIVPMLILAVIYNILFAFSQILFGTMSLHHFCNNLLGILFGNAFALAGLWFVYTLIIVKIASLILNENIKPLIACACIFFTVYISHRGYGDYYNCYVNALLAYPCFFIGELLGKYKSQINNLTDVRSLIAIIVVGAIGSVIAYRYNNTVWMYNGGYGSNIALFFLGSICGTAMCFGGCKLLLDKPNKFVLIISEGTILILAFHGLVIRLTHQINVGWLFYIESIILVIAFIPLIMLVQKYFPLVLGYRGVKDIK